MATPETPIRVAEVTHRGYTVEIVRREVEGSFARPGIFQFLFWRMFANGNEYSMADQIPWRDDPAKAIEALKGAFVQAVDEMLDGEPNGEGE